MSVAKKRTDPIPETVAPDPAPANVDRREPGVAKVESGNPRKSKRRLLMFSLPVALIAGGAVYWLAGGRYISTENAYVHQPMVAISADVAGQIVKVDVTENQAVEAGASIFGIDSEPYRIALDQAEASLAAARLSVAQLRAGYETAQAQLDAAESILEIKQRELRRQQSLFDRGLNASAALDEAMVSTRTAQNSVNVARRQLKAAAAALGGDPNIETDAMPAVRAAIANRDAAARNLEKTLTRAPVAGIVSQIESLNIGQHVATGSQVATLVQTEKTWIEANFKETQLDGIKIGQPVNIAVDAYPDLDLHGTVESMGSATGSQFSLIPAQNATGNWVKVVQRLSVRIRIDGTPERPLRDGMSAHVSVDTGHSHLDDLR